MASGSAAMLTRAAELRVRLHDRHGQKAGRATILRMNGLLNDLMAKEVGVNDGHFLPQSLEINRHVVTIDPLPSGDMSASGAQSGHTDVSVICPLSGENLKTFVIPAPAD
jgi:hypothetical protein